MNNEQTTGGIKAIRIICAAAAGILVMIIANVIFSALIVNELLSQGSIGLYVFASWAIGAAVSGVLCSHQSKALICGLISGAAYSLFRYALGVIIYHDSALFGLITGLLVSLAFSVLGSMLGTALRNK